MMGESPLATISQSMVAVALILVTGFLAYIDPSSRSLIAGVLISGLGVVIGYFFSQRATTNGVRTIAGIIAPRDDPPNKP